MLQDFVCTRRSGLVFCEKDGSQISQRDVLKYSLHPILMKLELEQGALLWRQPKFPKRYSTPGRDMPERTCRNAIKSCFGSVSGAWNGPRRSELSLSRGPSNWTTWTTGLFAPSFIFSAVVSCRIFCSAVSTCLGKGKGSDAIRSRGLLPSNKAERRKTSNVPDITRPEEMPERHNHGKIISELSEFSFALSHSFCRYTRFWRDTTA
jgi:hypothetical protein